jgi:hypothetical protein
VIYVPDSKIGTPPPYRKWKFIGVQDSQDNSPLKVAEMDERLRSRKRQ